MCWARFNPRESIWRRRILLNPIIEVSEAERKNEIAASMNKMISMAGEENSGCIY